MQLRYTKNISIYKGTKVKQPSGSYIEGFELEKDYVITIQELNDDVAVSMYGADLNNIIRIKSIKGELETFLKGKMNNEDDNISKYYVVLNDNRYKVRSVRSNWIDIELLGKFDNTLSM